jgi:membrane associated rhomboid family serine protease
MHRAVCAKLLVKRVEKCGLCSYVQGEMLEDRYYIRRSQFGSFRMATVVLVLVNVAVFIGQCLIPRSWDMATVKYFALSLWGIEHGYVWQLLTYQFMHAGLTHLLFNCLAIFTLGLAVESELGRQRFLTLYIASGVVGGLLQVLGGLLLGGPFAAPVVGASAAAFGIAAAFAMLFPQQTLFLFLIIPLRAKYLLALCAGLALLGIVLSVLAAVGIMPPADNIAHAAHLGGMLTGVVLVRYAANWEWRWPLRGRSLSARRLVKVHSQGSPWGRTTPPEEEELPPEEFLAREVDPILDKISAHGIQSLTERERRILETARQKIGKR